MILSSSQHPRLPLLILLVLMGGSLSCNDGGVEPDVCSTESPLHTYAEFPIGVATGLDFQYYFPEYIALVQNQFNRVTPENMFKFEYLHPTPDRYTLFQAFRFIEHAINNNQDVHGHTLIWHQQNPAWLESFEGPKQAWDSLMKDYIQTVVQGFRGYMSGWDVVNEAFNDDGTLRNNIWMQHIGAEYIEKAFRYAHEADRAASLFYNDYNLALNPVKRKAVISFLKELKSKGVPIDGIGMQMHIYTSFPENSEISKAMLDITQEGFMLHLSEIDISMNPEAEEMEQPPERELERQANKLAYLARTYKQIPHELQYGMTFWGVGDSDSWIRRECECKDYPLLFDETYRPKPAYSKLKEAL